MLLTRPLNPVTKPTTIKLLNITNLRTLTELHHLLIMVLLVITLLLIMLLLIIKLHIKLLLIIKLHFKLLFINKLLINKLLINKIFVIKLLLIKLLLINKLLINKLLLVITLIDNDQLYKYSLFLFINFTTHQLSYSILPNLLFIFHSFTIN